MVNDTGLSLVLAALRSLGGSVGKGELVRKANMLERDLDPCLGKLISQGLVLRTGRGSATRYHAVPLALQKLLVNNPLSKSVIVRHAVVKESGRLYQFALSCDEIAGPFRFMEEADFEASLTSKGSMTLVAEIGEEYLGYLYGTVEQESAIVWHLALGTDIKVSGVGEALLAACWVQLPPKVERLECYGESWNGGEQALGERRRCGRFFGDLFRKTSRGYRD